MESGLVDTHAHLTDDALLAEAGALIASAERSGVRAILSVGYDCETSRRALEMAAVYRAVGPTVGIHPTSILQASDEDFAQIERWAAGAEVAAIGETGLDFHWDTTPRERQREVFRWHLALASRLGLPLTIHSRDAEAAVLEEIRNEPPPGAALHCFGGDAATARIALGMGLYLGIGGPVTFKKSTDLHDLVRWLPLDRILLETDSPYLSPHPFRGKRNEPSRVALVAACVASLRGTPLETVWQATTENAFRLYPRLKHRWNRQNTSTAGAALETAPETTTRAENSNHGEN